ncbi:lantibiotic dehydratase C-terminal domain-containing protein [Streptomyces mirabilis]
MRVRRRRLRRGVERGVQGVEHRRKCTHESLLHMHHNRIMGPGREAEAACRHAARQACRSLRAQGATW